MVEHLDHNPFFLWFLGLQVAERVWEPATLSMTGKRLPPATANSEI